MESGRPDLLASSLGHVLMARVRRLSPETQELLGVVSVAGRPVGHGLLAAVTGLPPMDLTGRLREALDHHVLVVERASQAYAFRHALLRDAVYDDTLPGERVPWHTAFADALERDGTLGGGAAAGASELAYHRYAAFDLARALPAAVDAARLSAAAFGYAEALQLLERALEIWPQVPDAEAIAGTDYAGLLETAADLAFAAGDAARALRFADAALGAVDAVAEPERAALLLNRRAMASRGVGASPVPDLEEALRLVPPSRPSLARAIVLESLARMYVVTGAFVEVAAVAEEALAAARAVGAREQEANALTSLGGVRGYLGQPEEAVEMTRQALALSIEIGASETALRAHTNLSDTLLGVGRFEEAAEIAYAGLELARRIGLERSFMGSIDAFNLGIALKALGRWTEAERVVDRVLELKPVGVAVAFAHGDKAGLAAAQGRFDVAARHMEAAFANAGDEPEAQMALVLAVVRLEVAIHDRNWDLFATVLHDSLVRAGDVGLDRLAWPLLAAGARGLADAAQQARDLRRELAPRLLALAVELDAMAERSRPTPPTLAGYDALVIADGERRAGTRSVAAWTAAVDAWRPLGMPFPLAYALFRLAESRIAAGDRGAAGEALGEAVEIAARLGAQPLLDEATALGHAARLDVSGAVVANGGAAPEADTDDGGSPFGLTAREIDVLRLLAAGRTNAQIAADLYISPKTASVHVSNILAKLDVGNRVEAAAVAHRLGLVSS